MKKVKLFFLAALFVYHLVTVYVTLYLEKHVFELLKYLDYLAYGSFAGLLLFLGYLFINYLNIKGLKTELAASEQDKTVLKSKIYDQEEEEKRIDKSLKDFGNSLEK